jgi:bacteriocin-like protein
MTIESSKNEADKLTTNESSLTTNELNQVVGGMGPVFLSLMPYPKGPPAIEIKDWSFAPDAAVTT